MSGVVGEVTDETAATKDSGGDGPEWPGERGGATWLLGQRIGDLKAAMADLRDEVREGLRGVRDELRGVRDDVRRLDDKLEGVRGWAVGTVVAVIVAAGTIVSTILSRRP